MCDLSGRTALVSGAGAPGGIGFAIAQSLTNSGAKVHITSTSERIFDRAKEIGASASLADLTVESDCRRIVAELSTLDILVNNAGMTAINDAAGLNESGSLTEVTLEGLRKGIARNVETAFNLTKHSLPLLRQSSSGRIIMISSVTGAQMAMRHQPVYATAKAALIGLVRSLALDEAHNGITVNAVLPGWIATDTQNEFESAQGLRSPLGRSGRPEEIASLVNWLASSSSSYLTGQCLIVDGGNSIAEEQLS
mgnify:CR=1 FL=1